MNAKLEMIWKNSILAWSRCGLRICLDGIREPEEAGVRIAGVTTEIRTKHIPNTSQKLYCYTSLLGHMFHNVLIDVF
jgi:hypothetical protein